jgi:hypothetical protein
MNTLILAAVLMGAPADHVFLVPVQVVVLDHALLVRPQRSVVVKRTVAPVTTTRTVTRTYTAPPRVIRSTPTYYLPQSLYPSGTGSCPTCR